MSHKAGIAPPLISNKTLIIVLAICFSLLALTILHSLSGEEQNGKKKERGSGIAIEVIENTKDSKTIEVPLDPEKWSDWVELPLNFKNWELRAPGWLEFQFLNGDRQSLKDNEKFWWKNTPCRTFKLRGSTGKATIVIRL